MLIIPGDIAGPLWIKLLIAGLTLAFLIPAMRKVWMDWRRARWWRSTASSDENPSTKRKTRSR